MPCKKIQNLHQNQAKSQKKKAEEFRMLANKSLGIIIDNYEQLENELTFNINTVLNSAGGLLAEEFINLRDMLINPEDIKKANMQIAKYLHCSEEDREQREKEFKECVKMQEQSQKEAEEAEILRQEKKKERQKARQKQMESRKSKMKDTRKVCQKRTTKRSIIRSKRSTKTSSHRSTKTSSHRRNFNNNKRQITKKVPRPAKKHKKNQNMNDDLEEEDKLLELLENKK